MNITTIKTRAKYLLANMDTKQFKKILLIIMIMAGIPGVYNGDNGVLLLVSLLLTVMFTFLYHGFVVTGLKIAAGRQDELCDQDAYVGLTKFFKLLPTYLVQYLFVYGIVMLLSIVVIGGCAILIAQSEYFNADALNAMMLSEEAMAQALLNYAPTFITMILVIFLILVVVGVVLSAYVFAMPYLYEKYDIKGFKCLKQSIQVIKGHIFDYIKLELSFIGWILLSSLLTGIFTGVFANIPLQSLLTVVVGALVQVYLYYPHYVVSKAVFFERLTSETETEVITSEI